MSVAACSKRMVGRADDPRKGGAEKQQRDVYTRAQPARGPAPKKGLNGRQGPCPAAPIGPTCWDRLLLLRPWLQSHSSANGREGGAAEVWGTGPSESGRRTAKHFPGQPANHNAPTRRGMQGTCGALLQAAPNCMLRRHAPEQTRTHACCILVNSQPSTPQRNPDERGAGGAHAPLPRAAPTPSAASG